MGVFIDADFAKYMNILPRRFTVWEYFVDIQNIYRQKMRGHS